MLRGFTVLSLFLVLDQLETHKRIVHEEKLDLKANCCQGTHEIHWNEGR